MTMTNAVVLIEAERDALLDPGGRAGCVEGVAEAYSVSGRVGFCRDRARCRPRATGRCGDRRDRRAGGVTAHADDGRLCSFLAPRPRVAVLHRRIDRRGGDGALKAQYGPTLGQAAGAPLACGAEDGRGVVNRGWRRSGGACRRGGLPALARHVLPRRRGAVSLQLPGASTGRLPRLVQFRADRASLDGRLEDSFAVSPLRLPRYAAASAVELPLYASGYIRQAEQEYSGFVLRGEARPG